MLLGCLGLAMPAMAADVDARFHVQVKQQTEGRLTVKDAMRLGLPVLWKRVVPTQSMDKTYRLKGRTSLVLQYKATSQGVSLVFNPVQVQSYLAGFGITMIPQLPKWKLNIAVVGFSDNDSNTARELMNYSYTMADEFGFALTPRGKSLNLIFAPVVDEYGEVLIHANVGGDFSSDLLQETDRPAVGYLSYQLQDWTDEILKEIRDAYALGTLIFEDTSAVVMITVEGDDSLAAQVMLEQALRDEPEVEALVPVLLQRLRRQYRLTLKNEDDTWLESWFARYGLTAARQPEGSASQWLVQ
jgi:hypothetical protein